MCIRDSFPDNEDIISILADHANLLPFLQVLHVASHQDKGMKSSMNDLSTPAKINVIADSLVTRYNKQHCPVWDCWGTSQYPPIVPTSKATISCLGHRLTSKYTDSIHHLISERNHRQYLIQKYEWSLLAQTSLPWKQLATVAKSIPINDLHFFSKLVHDWLPLGKHRMYRSVSGTSSTLLLCPCYQKETETLRLGR